MNLDNKDNHFPILMPWYPVHDHDPVQGAPPSADLESKQPVIGHSLLRANIVNAHLPRLDRALETKFGQNRIVDSSIKLITAKLIYGLV